MRIFIFMLLTIFLLGCGNNNPVKEQKDELKYAIANAECTKDYMDRIFMDFKFGMSENEVNSHFQTLLDSGKIMLDSDGVFKYLFETKQGKILTSFSVQYYKGMLCEFILKFQKMNNEVYSSPELMMQFAQEVFCEKAKQEAYKFYIDSIGGNPIYYYVKGATIVKFSSFIEPYMSYACAPLCKMKQKEMENEMENKVRDTASDL